MNQATSNRNGWQENGTIAGLIATALTAALLIMVAADPVAASDLDQVLARENQAAGLEFQPVPTIDDWQFLRRASIDLIGRIPSGQEIRQYMTWPANERRQRLVDRLMADPRFADRWTAFFADMLRLRSNAAGGNALLAYVHEAVDQDLAYDELCRRLIATNGKANSTPEVGFILGDNADPLALASVTSQVFLGVRIGCAQCHDHPFDVWTRRDFYGLAAFYGKTRRVESQLTRVVYTTESPQTTIFWPPEDDSDARKPMTPKFPFELAAADAPFIVRLKRLRQAVASQQQPKETGPSVDDLLADSDASLAGALGDKPVDVVREAKDDLRSIDLKASLYQHSQLRRELAEMVTDPRNRLFAQAITNRLWHELVGRGFVEPVDDFRADNLPSHPRTLDYLAEEFVAGGYRFRSLVRMIVTSDAYQRGHAPRAADDLTREELEVNFLATPVRRMISESLYDSVVTAGHLFDVKHLDGQNPKVAYERIRVPRKPDGGDTPSESVKPIEALAGGANDGGAAMAMQGRAGMSGGGYALEDSIEIDFSAVLKKSKNAVAIEQMRVMSREELEAQRMMEQARRTGPRMRYETKMVKRTYDDNPKFNSSLRMVSPAPAGHFLRVFGQPARTDLGELRSDQPTMRQSLMMLNGRLTHEASRVGPLEPLHALLVGKSADLDRAIKMAYYETLTRPPSAAELAEGKEVLQGADSTLDGMADLRWVLLNCNEFRFIP